MNLKLARPVKWIRLVDRRLTQGFWNDFIITSWPNKWKWMYKQVVWRGWGHQWLDYAWPRPWQSIPVYSSHSWIVKVLNDKNWFGNCVVIEWNGYSTYYAHLANVYVKWWDMINASKQIWMMWSTGNSTAVHLHFWLKINWKRSDPTSYITSRPTTPLITPQEIDASTIWELLKQDKIRNGELWEGVSERLILLLKKLYAKSKNQ